MKRNVGLSVQRSGFWDPVGYTRDGSVETFKRRRETEIKHGRVAMYVAWHRRAQLFLAPASDKAFRIAASCQHRATSSIDKFVDIGEDAGNDSSDMHQLKSPLAS